MNLKRLRELRESYLSEGKKNQYWTDSSLKDVNKDSNYIDPEYERNRIEYNKRIRQSSRGKGNSAERRAIGKGLIPDTRPRVKEELNIYDILITHLLDEGYAEDVKNAYCILENMSEDWVLEILSEGYKKLPVGKMLRKAVEIGMRSEHPSGRLDTRIAGRRRGAKMGKIADEHNPTNVKRKEEKNRRRGSERG